jgi:hypothetical protein
MYDVECNKHNDDQDPNEEVKAIYFFTPRRLTSRFLLVVRLLLDGSPRR